MSTRLAAAAAEKLTAPGAAVRVSRYLSFANELDAMAAEEEAGDVDGGAGVGVAAGSGRGRTTTRSSLSDSDDSGNMM